MGTLGSYWQVRAQAAGVLQVLHCWIARPSDAAHDGHAGQLLAGARILKSFSGGRADGQSEIAQRSTVDHQ
jgi:hypothetical protein